MFLTSSFSWVALVLATSITLVSHLTRQAPIVEGVHVKDPKLVVNYAMEGRITVDSNRDVDFPLDNPIE